MLLHELPQVGPKTDAVMSLVLDLAKVSNKVCEMEIKGTIF